MINPRVLEAGYLKVKHRNGLRVFSPKFGSAKTGWVMPGHPRVFRKAAEALDHAEAMRVRWIPLYGARVIYLATPRPVRKTGIVGRLRRSYRIWRLKRSAAVLAATIHKLQGQPAADRFMQGFNELLSNHLAAKEPQP